MQNKFNKINQNIKSRLLLKSISILLLIFFSLKIFNLYITAYESSNRDTKQDPETIDFDIPLKNKDEYIKLYENENFIYRFKENTMVLAIEDKRNSYTWTSGLDNLSNREIDTLNEDAIADGKDAPYPPKEDRLNTIYTGIANSLVTLEYYDTANNVKLRSIGHEERVSSKMKTVSDQHFIIEVKHREPEVSFKLHMIFHDHGLQLEIPAESIDIPEESRISAFILSPFLGATGGVKIYWDEEKQEYSKKLANDMLPGYILVPDGPGALIRFRRNSTELQPYIGDVYGPNPSQLTTYYDIKSNIAKLNHPLMPLFGISHGRNQNAFIAYANSGAEHMEIVVQPENNMTNYTYAYPKFNVNSLYFQPYNKRGDGFYTMMKQPNKFDISMSYDFLQGDGRSSDYAANYVGMARRYRDYLIESNQLREKSRIKDNEAIPLNVDFLMSEVKKASIGFKEEILTRTKDVEAILKNLIDKDITNINSSLLGWQKGGYTMSKPWKASYLRRVGNKNKVGDLLNFAKSSNIDLALMQDYVNINSNQMNINGNVSKHISGYYAEVLDESLPFDISYYARPNKSREWLANQWAAISRLGFENHTIYGLSDILVNDYVSDEDTQSLSRNISELQILVDNLSSGAMISLDKPNQYLWKSTDRFLNSPVYSTQQLNQTDNVPFLQMILRGSMDVFSNYANFSFYTDSDILRMIDYNVYPNFLLTQESAHLLSDTNLISYYSTEYSFYKDLIPKVYEKVNQALSRVKESTWVDRRIIDDGVVLNIYRNDNNGKESAIAINYTKESIKINEHEIEGLNYHYFENYEGDLSDG